MTHAMSKTPAPSPEMIEVLVDGARYGDMEDVHTALQHDIDVNSADALGRTALHMAAANGHADVAATLIDAGAEVDVRNAEGNTPLHWACLNGCIEVADILLGHGASPASLNSHSNTPVDELLGKPYQDEMLALIESYQDTKTKGSSDPPDELTLVDGQDENKKPI